MFYEPDYKSCTKLIATVAKEKFGFDTKPLEDLIHWGDIIDGAQYPTAESAVEIAEPATQLGLVIEAAPKTDCPRASFRNWPTGRSPKWSSCRSWRGIWSRCWSGTATRSKSSRTLRVADGVIFFDVSDLDLEGYNKFIPYLLHPESVYSVSVSASAVRAKVSLGTNPWNQATADKNLASLAEKFGGGGHPRVSAISFEPGDLSRAREVARELVATLREK